MKKILFLTFISLALYSCSSSEEGSGEPVIVNEFSVKTHTVNNVSYQTATVYGVISPTHVSEASDYGICYGTTTNPTVDGDHTSETNINPATGTFYSNLTDLFQNSVYFARAYAITNNGPIYGEQKTFTTLTQLFNNSGTVTDGEGNTYNCILINSKRWMQENLNVTKYQNGDIIPEVTDMDQWDALTTGAWCWYENDTANGTVYGRLYNWYAVHDPRGLAPAGWHIPTQTEWTNLGTFLGGANVAGAKMRDNADHWSSSANVGTNQSGFTALPGGFGYLTQTYDPVDEPFQNLESAAFWWSSTSSGTKTAHSANIGLGNSLTVSSVRQKAALSVRCVKN